MKTTKFTAMVILALGMVVATIGCSKPSDSANKAATVEKEPTRGAACADLAIRAAKGDKAANRELDQMFKLNMKGK
jgi:hypothetical protein